MTAEREQAYAVAEQAAGDWYENDSPECCEHAYAAGANYDMCTYCKTEGMIRAAVDAVVPLLRAEGRREAAQAIRAVDVQRIRDLEGDTLQVGLTVAARLAEGGAP